MNFTDQHRDRFIALLDTLGCPTDVKQHLWQELEAAYQEPHRHYHTAQHIIECLELFDEYCAATPTLRMREWEQTIELAVWWHDIVYQTNFKAIGNERLSAAYAFWNTCNGPEVSHFVAALVLATDHTAERQHIEAPQSVATIADIDLAVLGAEPTRFAEYEDQIAQEYAHVPLAQYREARAHFLQSLLDRPRIYRTAYFYNRFEAKARANLTVLVEQLNIPLRRINEEEYRGAEPVFADKDVTIFRSHGEKAVTRSLAAKSDGILECTKADVLVFPPRAKGWERGDKLAVSAKNVAVEPGDHLYFVFFSTMHRKNPVYRAVVDWVRTVPHLRVVKDRHDDWRRAAEQNHAARPA